MRQKTVFILLACTAAFTLEAQRKNFPLNRQWLLEAEAEALKDSSIHLHTAMRPFIESPHFGYADYMMLNRGYSDFSCGDTTGRFPGKVRSWMCRKRHYEPLISVRHSGEDEWFTLGIAPLAHMEYGMYRGTDTAENILRNTRGVRAYGDIGTKFSFETSFWENQATYAGYVRDFNERYDVVPGEGRWKRFKTTGYDFAMASGYFSYSPGKNFNVQAGHGKHFIGDGYRSLLLSDNSFNYPYLRFTTSWRSWLQYTNIYASLMNLVPGGTQIPAGTERLFQKKAAAFQQLNLRLFKKKRLQIGFFQGLVWEAADTNNRQQLNFHYFNPVIFTSLPVYGLQSARNYLIGATAKWRVLRSFELYGQFMLDERGENGKPNALHNKTGKQLGLKYFNVFGLRHLHLQYEFNVVRPYSYATRDSLQSWTHYNQALAHPLGANFTEHIGFLNYKLRDFYLEARYSYAEVGADSAGASFGSNIFAGDHLAFYGVNSTVNEQGQGQKTAITHQDLRLGYVMAYASNLNIFAGYSNRIFTNASGTRETPFIYFGLRSALTNLYLDF